MIGSLLSLLLTKRKEKKEDRSTDLITAAVLDQSALLHALYSGAVLPPSHYYFATCRKFTVTSDSGNGVSLTPSHTNILTV